MTPLRTVSLFKATDGLLDLSLLSSKEPCHQRCKKNRPNTPCVTVQYNTISTEEPRRWIGWRKGVPIRRRGGKTKTKKRYIQDKQQLSNMRDDSPALGTITASFFLLPHSDDLPSSPVHDSQQQTASWQYCMQKTTQST